MKQKPIVVGFDFDGVIAYNPARIVRYPISYVKRNILGIKKMSFFVPKNNFQRNIWALAHETSIVPAIGSSLLRELVHAGVIEAHLVTARFGYLEPGLIRFLKRWRLHECFRTITVNHKEEQPHRYKSRVVGQKKFDVYIEDNWDIVTYLNKTESGTKVHWIYNILDRSKEYPYKYPYLKKSLEEIVKRTSIQIPNPKLQ